MNKVCGLLLILSFFAFCRPVSAQINDEQTYKMVQFLNYVNNYYVDSTNNNKIVETAIRNVLKELDPHSVYVSKDDVRALNEPLEGNFDGIGIQYNVLFDTILILSVVPNGPSDKVGLMPGDRIMKIGTENVAGIGINTQGVRTRLLGKKGSRISLSVKRRGLNRILDFDIERESITIHSIEASYMVDEQVGYIKLDKFSANTLREFDEAVKRLQKQGMKSMILDLEGNGGGYLNVAIDLADRFLDDDKMILYTEGTNSPRSNFISHLKGNFEKGNLVLLIDEGSASASEILSGAIQDWDRGLIIGRRSFGKGLVQRPFMLNDGSLIRLTVARYYTPTGRLIQKSYNKGIAEYKNDINTRYLKGEMISKDSIHFIDSLRYLTLKKKRLVYGGGGIMPDIFVPIDTTKYSSLYKELHSKNVINTFVLSFIDRNREALVLNYPDFKIFKEKFSISDDHFNYLLQIASKLNVQVDLAELDKCKDQMKIQFKALIARDLWDMSEYYEIINSRNNSYCKAIEVLTNKKGSPKELDILSYN